MKNEKFYSQFKKTHGIQKQEGLKEDGFQTVLRTAGGTETTQEKIYNWLQLDGDPRFQLLTEE
jgi:hypothetical protein